jgi:hypothetical protein
MLTFKAIPPTLGGVVIAAMTAKILKWPVKTLADIAGAEVCVCLFSRPYKTYFTMTFQLILLLLIPDVPRRTSSLA